MGHNIRTKWSNTIPGWLEMKVLQGNRFAVDWCGAYDVNLNEYIFTSTCKGLCSRFKCVKKEVSFLPFCSCFVLQQKEMLLDSLYICRGIFRAQSNIYNGTFFAKMVKMIKPLTIFKKAPSQIFDWVQNMPPIWMYLVIFRPLTTTFNHYCTILQIKIWGCIPLFLEDKYMLIR